tara:strand:+ start:544 stop:717 length:174 start_codon:yes stop_codon:yes gene_type:complete
MKYQIIEKWLTLKNVCELTSLSSSTIHRAINRGEIKVSKVTGKLLFKASDIERWLNA